MPVRGFLVILAIALAAAAGWFFYVRHGLVDLNEPTVSRDITIPRSDAPAGVPSFDIVRIDPSGPAVISGHAAAGAKVSLLAGKRPIGDAIADARGAWTIVIEKALKGASEITASARARDGTVKLSEEAVIIDVPKPGFTPLAVLERPDAASHILQRPDEMGEAPLALEIADYIRGEMLLSGRAGPRSAVRIYIDNEPCGTAIADDQGEWTLRPKPFAPGAYTMRIDQLRPKEDVAARIEVPFERADPDLLASHILGKGDLAFETGVTQWRIARRTGTGFRLTVLYPANQDQIRDPNLLYPGQIFERSGVDLKQ